MNRLIYLGGVAVWKMILIVMGVPLLFWVVYRAVFSYVKARSQNSSDHASVPSCL